jgi:hypothetical protein
MRVGEHDGSQLPPPKVLREDALLAGGERGCLIGPEGECAWLCFPRWDSDPVLCSLLGAPGSYCGSRWSRAGTTVSCSSSRSTRSTAAPPIPTSCGRRQRSRARATCGPPGLFCEEYDVEEHRLRGNLPQAFIHALLLECAGTLSPSSGA